MSEDELERPLGRQGNGEVPKEPHSTTHIQEVIGQGLRAMYDSLKAEPIPDHLLKLLQRLDTPKKDEGQ
ncbi:hypothetical protein DES45_102585 [Microvirga subterranea]|uniref:Anti-sigma factor NepR domain-containing protein n=2 Tax=Microvirga subterranea TaxID=186651 RepID=A0A370HSC2_9HYPH|nr:hypothetical protein DES45_102585 [Microvirga subterranea]